MAIYLLEEKHFQIFQNEAQALLAKLGITDWSIAWTFEECEDGNHAECRVNRAARHCIFALSRVWWKEPTECAIKDSAQHEVLELLLDDMEQIFWLESLSEDDKHHAIARARHAIIHRLQQVL